MARAVLFLAAAAAGYVLLRAGWIFVGWMGVIAVVLLVAALGGWRRRSWTPAAGAALGVALSSLALVL